MLLLGTYEVSCCCSIFRQQAYTPYKLLFDMHNKMHLVRQECDTFGPHQVLAYTFEIWNVLCHLYSLSSHCCNSYIFTNMELNALFNNNSVSLH